VHGFCASVLLTNVKPSAQTSKAKAATEEERGEAAPTKAQLMMGLRPAGLWPAFGENPQKEKPGAKPGFQYMDGLVSTGK